MGFWRRCWWKRTPITQREKKNIDASDADAAAAATEDHVISSYESYDDDQHHDHQLPEHIITEILSRLPPLHVMNKFRYICKLWFALTSTQSFRKLHYKNQQQLHTFVTQYHTNTEKLDIHFFNEKKPTSDTCFENRQLGSACFDITLYQMKMKPLITQFYEPTLISSYKGFLLFKQVSDAELVLIFHNPITGEQVSVTAPASRYLYCGFYFHSPTEEYRVLFQILDDDDDEYVAGIGFAILGMRTRSLRRIRNSSHHCPSSSAPPIILNGSLHWMVSASGPSCSEAILSFGMESEEFHVMPHLGDECAGGEGHGTKMVLGEMDGQLCLCVSCDSSTPYHSKKLNIWVLEDYKEWIWAKRTCCDAWNIGYMAGTPTNCSGFVDP